MSCHSDFLQLFLSDQAVPSGPVDNDTVPDVYDTEKAANFRALATSTTYTV